MPQVLRLVLFWEHEGMPGPEEPDDLADVERRLSPRRRKLRMLRAVAPADDLLVVVRAVGDDIAAAVADMVADALDSAGTYAVERGGVREVLCGVSVFALGDSVDVAEVLARFPDAPRYLRLTVGALRSAVSRCWPLAATRTISIFSSCLAWLI